MINAGAWLGWIFEATLIPAPLDRKPRKRRNKTKAKAFEQFDQILMQIFLKNL